MSTLNLDTLLVVVNRLQHTNTAPIFSGVIRESTILVDTTFINCWHYHLSKKGKRRVWVRHYLTVIKLETPSRSGYRLPDGSMIVHPVVAAELKRVATVEPKEFGLRL